MAKKPITLTHDDYETLTSILGAEIQQQKDFRDNNGLGADFRAEITDTLRMIRKLNNKLLRMYRAALKEG